MTAQDLAEISTAQTVCNIGILLSILSFLLYISRPYFERILNRFTLRVAADLWWVVYIIFRDGSLLAAFLLGLSVLNLDLFADIKVALPFVPLGTVCIAIALLLKVLYNTEDMNKYFLRTTFFVAMAAALNGAGYILIMEAPGKEYAEAQSGFWVVLHALRSNNNPVLSSVTFYVTITLLVAILAIATVRVFALFRQKVKELESHV